MRQKIVDLTIILAFALLLALFAKLELGSHSQITAKSSTKITEPVDPHPKQVVFLIIDALRRDYINQMPVFNKTVKEYPQHSFMADVQVADPTMTTQRVESLMTGSEIFSSGDILKTFFASKVTLDNLISQLQAHNKSAAVYGDDTWVRLFDFGKEQEGVCTNSYDVRDYHSCDQKVYKGLSSQVYGEQAKKNNHSLIVGHLLGADHIGHATSSVKGPQMEQKLQEVSQFVELIIGKMGPDTMLLVTGDHGMRGDGNHGGSSQQQKRTLLMGVWKGGKLSQSQKRVIRQRDITATLSILLDVSIPANCLGYPIFQELPFSLTSSNSWKSVNEKLMKHVSLVRQYYRLPITQSERKRWEMQLHNTGSLHQAFDDLVFELEFLSYSVLQTAFVLPILALMWSIALYGLFRILSNQQGSLMARLLSIFPYLTLFFASFSWLLLRHLSSILLLMVIATSLVLTFTISPKPLALALSTLSLIFLLCQIQPDKINQYELSFFRIQWLHNIIGYTTFQAICLTFCLMVYLRGMLRGMRVRAERKGGRLQGYMRVTILILAWFNHVTTYDQSVPFYPVRVAIFIIGVIWLLFGPTSPHRTIPTGPFLLLTLSSLWLGRFAPLIVMVFWCWWKLWGQLQGYGRLVGGLMAQCVWWWLGNRFEYSGVDALGSFIFSGSYNPWLNSIGLAVYLVCPQLLIMALFQYPITFETQSKTSGRIEEQEIKKNQGSILSDGLSQVWSLCECGVWTLVCGLCGMGAALHYNHQKILFTIVYVPMFVLTAIKTLLLLSVVFVISLKRQ